MHVERQVGGADGGQVGGDDGMIDERTVRLDGIIDQGARSVVYKGHLNDTRVAVKYFNQEMAIGERDKVRRRRLLVKLQYLKSLPGFVADRTAVLQRVRDSQKTCSS